MGRRYHGWTAQAIQARGVTSRQRLKRRVPRCGAFWGQHRSCATAQGWQLAYYGWLPHLSNKIVHPMARYRLKQCGCRALGSAWGAWDGRRRPGYAQVEMIRVLGPGQRAMDSDNFAILVAGLRDALTACAYIRDDSPTWAAFRYLHDASRRAYGPFIEITIAYPEV